MRLLNWAWKTTNERYRSFIVFAGWKTGQLLSACSSSNGFLSPTIERPSASKWGRKKQQKTPNKFLCFSKGWLTTSFPMRQTKFTQWEINRLRSFCLLHFQRPARQGVSALGRWASRPRWDLCLIASERKKSTSAGLMSPVLPSGEAWLGPSFFLMLSSLSFASQWEGSLCPRLPLFSPVLLQLLTSILSKGCTQSCCY